MSQQELVIRVITELEQAAIPYMLTGSLVSSYQGEPRSSHDVDLVVSLDATHIETLLARFAEDEFYLSRSAIEDAIRSRTMFNLLAHATGDKVDFWLLTDSPFDIMRFSRRQLEPLFDRPIYVSSPEDTILQKLYWSLLANGSEKQYLDALRIFEVQSTALDEQYLRQWADALNVRDQFDRIQREAERI